MAFDATDYKKRVLTPFKSRRQRELTDALREMQTDPRPKVPAALDLVELYDMPAGPSDAQAAAQVAAAKDVFTKAQGNGSLKNIGPTLVRLHQLLAEANPDLSSAKFWAARSRERDGRARGRTDEVVAVVVEESRVLGVVAAARVVALAGAANVPVDEVKAAVRTAGVTVVPPAPTPAARIEPALLTEMGKTACASLVEVIFLEDPPASFAVLDGFVGDDGQRLTTAQVERSRQVAARRPSGDDQNAAVSKVLGMLSRLDDRALEQTVLAWFVDAGERAAEQEPALQFALRRLTDTRLRPEDAARLLVGHAQGRRDSGFPDVERKVGDGALREARRLFEALTAATGGSEGGAAAQAREVLSAAEGKVAALRREAERAASAGDVASALAALGSALTLCTDDPSLEQARDGLPPAPPRVVTLSTGRDGRTVVVSWEAGMGTTEEVRFTVVCKVGSAPRTVHDGTVVAEDVSATRFEHRSPRVAERVHYGVAATRGTHFSPVVSQEILVLPPVRAVRAASTPTSITLSWDPPAQARAVRVEQLAPDGRRTALRPQTHGGVVCHGLVTNATYTYLLTAVYASTSGDLEAEPVRRTATPRGAAVPVDTLEVVPHAGAGGATMVEVSWRHVPGFDVEVWHCASRPPWRAGTRVRVADLEAVAERLTGTSRRDGALEHLVGSVPLGLRHHVPVTRDGEEVVVGTSAEAGACPALGEVSVERFVDVVVLAWEWPGPAFDVDVAWQGGLCGSRRLSRAEYVAEGGLRVRTAGAARIALRTVPAGGAGRWSSAESVVEVAGATSTVRYTTTWKRWLGRPRAVTLRFTSEESPGEVPVVVTTQAGHVMPRDRHSGTVVAEQPLDLSSGEATLTVPVSGGRPHLWVRAFAQHPDRVHLVDPPAATLRGA